MRLCTCPRPQSDLEAKSGTCTLGRQDRIVKKGNIPQWCMFGAPSAASNLNPMGAFYMCECRSTTIAHKSGPLGYSDLGTLPFILLLLLAIPLPFQIPDVMTRLHNRQWETRNRWKGSSVSPRRKGRTVGRRLTSPNLTQEITFRTELSARGIEEMSQNE